MIVVGGIAFCWWVASTTGSPGSCPLSAQGIVGGTVITGVELLSGLFLNLYLNLNIWDYSGLPFNVLGQICLPFWALWCLLAVAAVVADDYLRYWLFAEEKPHYRFAPSWGGK